MTSTHTFTHRDLATLLGVSETTIKSYRTKFSTFLPVARAGKPVRLHPEALEVCRAIRRLFGEGLSVAQTEVALRAEFKEFPQHRRLSIARSVGAEPSQLAAAQPAGITAPAGMTAPAPQASPQAEAQVAQLSELVRQLHEAQLRAQEQAQERINMLEAEVRNLATLEAASKELVAELVHELRASRAQDATRPGPAAPEYANDSGMPEAFAAPTVVPEPAAAPGETVLTARKIVTVHPAGGPAVSYALNREAKPEPLFRPAAPPRDFLELPAVIRSERGDFLGLPGGQSIARLVDALNPGALNPAVVPLGTEAQPPTWLEDGPEAWLCLLPLGRAQTRELSFERTKTPRGNLVGVIRRMRQGEAEASPQELQELFRHVRDQLA